MSDIKKIGPAIFIALYSLVLCHSFIPHFHIENDEADVSHHEHHFDHHHHHEHESSSSWYNGIIDFLNHLGHKDLGENHLDEYLAKDPSQFTTKSVKDLNCTLAVVMILTKDLTVESEKTDRVIRPPILYEHQSSSSEPLRGPPSIS